MLFQGPLWGPFCLPSIQSLISVTLNTPTIFTYSSPINPCLHLLQPN